MLNKRINENKNEMPITSGYALKAFLVSATAGIVIYAGLSLWEDYNEASVDQSKNLVVHQSPTVTN